MNTNTTTTKNENVVVSWDELDEALVNFEELEDGEYKVTLTNYNIVKRADGKLAILMNFNVEEHDVTLFRYQMMSHFMRMIGEPVGKYMKKIGAKVTTKQELLETMKTIPVPIKYKRINDGEYEYTFNFLNK